MNKADSRRRHAWAWALAAVAPAALQAGEPTDMKQAVAPVDPGLLEFLAEEPPIDEELGKALMTGDLDRAIERTAARSKVKDDDKDTN